jgi:hypothetical protein
LVAGGAVCCTAGAVGAGVVTEGTVTVGATVVTVWAGAGFCVDGATVADCVAVAVGELVTTGSLDGTVMDDVAVAVAVDGTVDGAEVAVEDDGAEVAVELLGDDELAVSVADVEDVALDEPAVLVGSEVDVLVEVADASVEVAVVDDEVVVDVLDDEDDDVVSTTGTGNRVSGEDGRTGIGSPGGGSVAAGSCSTTL